MANEKISFNATLMSLPLVADTSRLSRCDCRDDLQDWDVDGRLLTILPVHWQPGLFFIRKAGADSGKFVLTFHNARTNATVASFSSSQITYKVFRLPSTVEGGQAWDIVTVQGGTNLTIQLPEDVYYLTVAGLRSEPFRIQVFGGGDVVPPLDSLLFELKNPSNLSEIPYLTGYTQRFGLAGNLCAGETLTYEEKDASERYGDRTTYYRQYRVWTLDYLEVPIYLAELLKSLEQHSEVIISDNKKTITVPGSQLTVSIKSDTCCTLSVSIRIEETLIETGVCSGQVALTELMQEAADIGYQDSADTDPDADPFEVSSGNSTVVPVVVPVAGTILNETTDGRTCANAFDNDGTKYQTRKTLTKADGQGGYTLEFIYSDPCEATGATTIGPRLPNFIKPIFIRAGRAINLPAINPALFAPAAGFTESPTVTATSLPAGVTYTGGRLMGTPTEEGETTAIFKVTQPGGGSIEIPVKITTIPAVSATSTADITVTTDYSDTTNLLSIGIVAPFAVEVRKEGQDWVLTDQGDQLDTWQATLPFVGDETSNISIRRAGSDGEGITFPICACSSDNNGGNGNPKFDPANLTPEQRAALLASLGITWRSLLLLPGGNDVGDIDIKTKSYSVDEINLPETELAAGPAVWYQPAPGSPLTVLRQNWIRFGEYITVQMNSPVLGNFIKKFRDFDFVLSGSKNFYRVTKQGEVDANGTPLEAGLFGLIERINGSQLVDYFFGRFTSGGVGFRNATGRSIALTGTEMLIDATVTTTTGILEGQRIRTASLPLATKPIKGAWTGEYNPLTEKYDQVFSDGEQLAELVRPYLSGTGTQVPGDARPVLEVLCRDVDSGSAPVVNPPVKLTPGMVGVPQSHSLNTPGTNIFPILLDINNRFDQIMVITFPSNTTFQIDYPEGLSSGYDGGSLELKKFS